MRAVEVFKRSSSDWYPAFRIPLGCFLVKVSFLQLSPIGGWRVCAWGGDDFGLEKDFDDEKEAWTCFLEVIGLDDVSHEELKALGFRSA